MQGRKSISIKAPILKFADIRNRAEEFRNKYVTPVNLIPVPVTEILEIDLGIQLIPKQGILTEIDVDAFLTNDLKSIYIDQNIYMNQWCENRQRFTFAHELGHLILHPAEIRMCRFRTTDSWVRFHQDMDKEDMDWFETQAREFAGRLLVPLSVLESKIRTYLPQIRKFNSKVSPDKSELLKEAVARVLCRDFKVSADVILKRIEREKLGNLFVNDK